MALIQELRRIRAPVPFGGMGLSLIGPTLLELGTDEQKQRHLPPIVRGEIAWCQGYSEPSSGSDLASLRTRAVDNGDHFVINGQKIWTSGAQVADWMFALVRTDPDVPKHDGISFVLLTMHQPGVTVKPIRLISGDSPFCETFFDDAIAQKADLIGELNKGWTVGKRLLQFERGSMATLVGGAAVREAGPTLESEARKFAGERNGRIADDALRSRIVAPQHQRPGVSPDPAPHRRGSEGRAHAWPPPPPSSRPTAPSCSRTNRRCSWRCAAPMVSAGKATASRSGKWRTRAPSLPTARRRSTPAATKSNATSSPSACWGCPIDVARHVASVAAAVLVAATVAACGPAEETERVEEVPDMPQSEAPAPPVAEARAHSFTMHGYTVEDPYHWLKDDSYPTVDDADVLAYLKAENAYFEARMAPRQASIDKLFEEIKARQQPDDANVPVKDGAYYYQWRFEEGGQYRIWSRWPAEGEDAGEGPTADAKVILDEPALAAEHDYFRLGALAVSNDGRLLAYSTDTSGGERFTLRIKDLETGELLPDAIENVQGSPVWAADDSAFFYTLLDDQWRPYQIRLHVLGAGESSAENDAEGAAENVDAIIYEEEDPGFFAGVSLTSSKAYVVISTSAHTTSEVRLVPAADPHRAPLGRLAEAHRSRIRHRPSRRSVHRQDQRHAQELALGHSPGKRPVAPPIGRNSWRRPTSATSWASKPSRNSSAVEERIDGVDQILILNRDGSSSYIDFAESAYTVGLGDNEEFDTRTLRLDFASMVTPNTVFDYALDTAQLRSRKVRRIPSGYDPSQYVAERIKAPARERRLGSRFHRLPQGLAERCCGATLPVRLRGLRQRHHAVVLHHANFVAGPRLRIRHRAHSRRRRTRLPLVRSRQVGPAQQYVQRFRGRGAASDRRAVHLAGAHRDCRVAARGENSWARW